jgi:hypothetical protein
MADELEKQAQDQNTEPVAVVGEGFEVTDNDGDGVETVTVDGSASADPDGKIVSYLWSFGGEWVSSDAVATVTLPIGTHRLQLTVTDDKGAEGKARLRIRVREGEPTPEVIEETPEADAVQPTEPALPPTPYKVEVVQKFAEAVISWRVDGGTPPYRIYRTTDSLTAADGSEIPLDELEWVLIHEEWEKLSYRDAAVEPGVPYHYVVKSFDGVNESEFSNVASITLQPVVEEPVVDPTPTEEAVLEVETPVEEPTVVEEPVVEPTAEEAVVDDAAPPEEPTE